MTPRESLVGKILHFAQIRCEETLIVEREGLKAALAPNVQRRGRRARADLESEIDAFAASVLATRTKEPPK